MIMLSDTQSKMKNGWRDSTTLKYFLKIRQIKFARFNIKKIMRCSQVSQLGMWFKNKKKLLWIPTVLTF